MKDVVLTPAYGRDYKSAVEAETAWLANYDFKIGTDGPYVNRGQSHDLAAGGFTHVKIRYARLERAVIIKLDVSQESD